MRIINYDGPDKHTGRIEGHVATDEAMYKKFGTMQRAYEDGFSASSRVRGGAMKRTVISSILKRTMTAGLRARPNPSKMKIPALPIN